MSVCARVRACVRVRVYKGDSTFARWPRHSSPPPSFSSGARKREKEREGRRERGREGERERGRGRGRARERASFSLSERDLKSRVEGKEGGGEPESTVEGNARIPIIFNMSTLRACVGNQSAPSHSHRVNLNH